MCENEKIIMLNIGHDIKTLNIQSQYCKKCKDITLHKYYDSTFESYGFNIYRKCCKCDNRTVEIFQ